ncbi:MAG: DsrE family protein [Betaproteobacteria bacterium]|nr:DsrE family protein [Betaproteobacteria bacterium]
MMKNARAMLIGGLLGTALLAGCSTMGLGDTKGNVAEDKVVYHVNDTEEQAVDALRNIGNHLEVNPKAKIVVVTHSRGVDFLFKDARDKRGNPYNVAVEGLKERGVQFDVCLITLRNRKLGKDKFIPEATFVPSGVAEITRLQQREGYAYLRP